MKHYLDHDWHGNMASPRKNLGEKTKLHSFIILSIVWIFFGLIGHEPWRPLESSTISQILVILQDNQFIHPSSSSNEIPAYPPLYAFFAASFAKILSPIFEIHDGARLSNALWLSLTMISIALMTKELWGKGFGRTAGLFFIASIGLIINIHTLTPEISALTGFAFSLYAFSLYFRRPFRASVILGGGISVLFLSNGFLPTLSIFLTAILLSFLSFGKNRRYFIFLGISFLISFIIIGTWLVFFNYSDPNLFNSWIQQPIFKSSPNFWYPLQGIAWFTWPAFPLAIWMLQKNYKKILDQKKLLLPLVFILAYFLLISFSPREDQINLLPFIIPFCLLAIGSIDLLKRGYASALNWFGFLIFGFFSLIIWLGWFAMQTGIPEKIFERMFFLSGNFSANFEILNFLISFTLTMYWLINSFTNKITNRSSITNWAIGITTLWVLLIALWGPFINNYKSHKNIYSQIKPFISQSSSCLFTRNLTNSQRDLLHYYTNIIPIDSMNTDKKCRLALVSLSNGSEIPAEFVEWKEIWTGKKIRDKFYYILLSE